MKGMREIRTRIKAVRSTAQITRAMQLVSSSKMKKAQDSVLGSRPYAALLVEILNALTHHIDPEDVKHPFFEPRPVKNRCVLLVTTDKGLCGGLNQNLLKQLHSFSTETRFVVVGQKGMQYVGKMPYTILGHFPFPDNITFRYVKELVNFLLHYYDQKSIDTVEVLFPRFKNTLSQEPTLRTLLPMLDFSQEIKNFHAWLGIEEEVSEVRPMILEPSASYILERLPLLFLKKTVYQILLEAKASEHSARMVAMKSATDNAESLIDDLQLEYNKARQASITQEILEITASQQAQISQTQ